MQILHFFIVLLLLFSSIFVLISKNPVHSVLFLILAFCNASIILFLFIVDFIGLIFIIIYVGAIAVLFLFVVMMLNVKIYALQHYNLTFISIFLILLFFVFSFILSKSFSVWNFNLIYLYFFFDNLTNIDVSGQMLYNYFLICFLIAGFILLLAIIGPIVLTSAFNIYKVNTTSAVRQLSRSSNFLSFFK